MIKYMHLMTLKGLLIMNINEAKTFIQNEYTDKKATGLSIKEILDEILSIVSSHDFPVDEKVELSRCILNLLSEDDRINLCKILLTEQVAGQRDQLNKWSTITAQSSQIDTGYIAQHLCSLRTQIPGQGMRGKGDDLSDGSEVKSANFLDSLDKKGKTSPRWNFTAITPEIMERFLEYESLYLLTIDLDSHKLIRIRIWNVDVTKHNVLKNRYIEWMEQKGRPKFDSPKAVSVNFQLFPPRMGEDSHMARHGSNRDGEMEPIEINLEDGHASKLIFSALQIEGTNNFNVTFH